VPAQPAHKNGKGAEERGGQHAAAAVAVGVAAIGEGDVEGAGGGDQAARGVARDDADGERQSYTQRIAESDPGRDLPGVEVQDGIPEGGSRGRGHLQPE
jgi:hypothetical protein